jgi:NADH dehydrogenase [ubiquinone] 1 alpha subcomplex assembly factor 1
MGGRSTARVAVADGLLRFTGTLSLAQGGGFASVRSVGASWNLDGADSLVVRLRGDGRAWQLRLYDDVPWQGRAIAHSAALDAGADWVEAEVALDALVPVFRGRGVPAPGLARDRVTGIGLMLADRRPGPFRLEVAAIRARRRA